MSGLDRLIRPGVAITLLLCAVLQAAELNEPPVNLSVGEGFTNPLGYYESVPRFSWQLPPKGTSDFQSAYQLQVASAPDMLGQKADLWDSGKVRTDDSTWVRYAGTPLSSRQQLFWRVRVWNEHDQVSHWSPIQSIELGLLTNEEWQGDWIGHPATASASLPAKEVIATPQYLRKVFSVSGEIKQARLYITAKGLFKPFLNGADVSKDVMTPGWTPYKKRIETLAYDVTTQLTQGENVIAASLAGGWYSGRIADRHDSDHVLPPRLLAQLEITYEGGATQSIATDGSWTVSQNGPIRFASIYDGERYEQALEMPGWTAPGFDSDSWVQAIAEPLDDDVALRPKRHRPIRVTQELPVQELIQPEQGTVIFDFGQNMVGVPIISLPAIAGQEIRVRFAEALHKGQFYTDNYRSAKSTNVYLPSKTGRVTYQPTFTYHGYRYLEISGFDASKTPRKDWVSARVQHSDMALHASFESSHAKLNQLTENIVWGMRGNFYDIPLDCPQRDERLGWTGDAQVFATSSMYMADAYGFWSAWLQSMREEQSEEGLIPLYIPFVEWINWASSGWGDAATIIPWELYLMTGDVTLLEENYEMMNRWLAYHESQSADYISHMKTFGDWLQPYPQAEESQANRGDTPFELISTAYYARSVELTMKAAGVLGEKNDVARLAELHKQLKNAFRKQLFDAELMLREGEATQTSYLLGLAFGLFDQSERALAQRRLIELINDADVHLRTGFLGTPLLAPVLQSAGHSDLVYQLLFRETYPSWFYSINNGATTTWERWDSYSLEQGFNPQGMNSLNHYAYGSISRWFYEGILGITPSEPGFKRIRIEPQFGHELSWASGSYPGPQGEIKVEWNLKGRKLDLEITVPRNSLADVVLPEDRLDHLALNGMRVETKQLSGLAPGKYQITGTRIP